MPSSPPHHEDDEMGDVEESFVYIDNDGNSVPPEEETSWLMAIGVRGHGHGAVSNTNTDGVSSSAQPTSDSTPPVERQYAEDPANFERERQLAVDRLQAVLLAMNAPAGTADTPSADGAVVGGDQPASAPPEDVLHDDEEEEGEYGMGEYAFSREATNEDDWVLERIMDRRTIKGGSKGGSDYKEFYDDFGEKKTGMMAAGRVEYMCKWKWYAEPTWETREMLEDEGYFKELKAFEDTALKGVGVVASKWSDVHGERPSNITEVAVSKSSGFRVSAFGDDTAVVALAGITPQSISALFTGNLRCLTYGCCAKQTAINAFLSTYSALSQTHRPVMLFHGTQSNNIYPIAMNGLRVPRSAADVKCGSAYGMGIYAAPSPITSTTFCGNSGLMFMCVGLVSNEDPKVRVCGDYCTVFFDSKLILPLWLLEFDHGRFSAAPSRRLISPSTMTQKSGGSFPIQLVAKMSPDQGKAMRKVRNANILNINTLAKKIGA